MARFNEILVGRYNRFLQKLFSMKGDAVVPQLASEIVPSFNFFGGVENRYLESWFRYANFIAVNAVAAQNATFNMRNPAGSNVIAVIEKIICTNSDAAVVQFNIFGPAPATSAMDLSVFTSNTRFDARGQQNSGLILSTGNNPSPTTGFTTSFQWWTAFLGASSTSADVILTDDQEFPLLPGDGFRVVTQPANHSINVSLMWRERFLEDSERS